MTLFEMVMQIATIIVVVVAAKWLKLFKKGRKYWAWIAGKQRMMHWYPDCYARVIIHDVDASHEICIVDLDGEGVNRFTKEGSTYNLGRGILDKKTNRVYHHFKKGIGDELSFNFENSEIKCGLQATEYHIALENHLAEDIFLQLGNPLFLISFMITVVCLLAIIYVAYQQTGQIQSIAEVKAICQAVQP